MRIIRIKPIPSPPMIPSHPVGYNYRGGKSEMGLSASKRARHTISNSPIFRTACDEVFEEVLSQTEGRFPGIFPYQLLDGAQRLHHRLRSFSFPLLNRWLPSPPSQAQVDNAYRSSIHSPHAQTLDPNQFHHFAVTLFTDAVVSAAIKQTALILPLSAAEIAAVGIVTKARSDFIGGFIVAYALTAATSIYLSLGN